MKTRSNDIIPNAPLKYNSSITTLEIGSHLYVDGSVFLGSGMIYGGDSSSNNICSIDLSDSGFIYLNGANVDNDYVYFEMDKGVQLGLTDKNVKTLFGNQSIVGSGNIDLYRHQLTGSTSNGVIIYMQIISSNNLVIDSIQDLTTVTKAVNGYVVNGIVRVSGVMYAAYINYDGSVWTAYYNNTNSTISTINDVVTTI